MFDARIKFSHWEIWKNSKYIATYLHKCMPPLGKYNFFQKPCFSDEIPVTKRTLKIKQESSEEAQ